MSQLCEEHQTCPDPLIGGDAVDALRPGSEHPFLLRSRKVYSATNMIICDESYTFKKMTAVRSSASPSYRLPPFTA